MLYSKPQVLSLLLLISLSIALQISIYEESLTTLKILDESNISTQPTKVEPDLNSDDMLYVYYIIIILYATIAIWSKWL